MKKYKFRIFVDGSFDNAYNIGTIAYHMQDSVYSVDGKLIKLCIANKTFASQVKGCKDSFDAEICAVGLGFDIFRKALNAHPILKKVPVRVKSDNLHIVKYITKGIPIGLDDIKEGLLEDLETLKMRYSLLRNDFPNFKLSYIPSKQNLAHDNAIEMLRWERLQRINSL